MKLKRIISGGQTGVDQGALQAAIDAEMDHGGWCPRGRRCEDGQIPPQFKLAPTESKDYAVRTRANVRDSDGTLILCLGPLTGGTELTHRIAMDLGRPVLCVNVANDNHDLQPVRLWLEQHGIQVLNVAGPRESSHCGIQQLAYKFLSNLFAAI